MPKEDARNERRSRIRNEADQLIFTTEKTLKELEGQS